MTEPTHTPVLIVGSGSAGLCAAVWLARLGIPFVILERRAGPLEVGQADGVQTRTVEIFDSFGLAEDMLREAYHVLEIAFWSGEEEAGISRQRYAADLEEGVSHQPHVILNQARVNALMVGDVRRSLGGGGRDGIEYGVEVTRVTVVEEGGVRVEAVKGGEKRVYKADYVLVSSSVVGLDDGGGTDGGNRAATARTASSASRSATA